MKMNKTSRIFIKCKIVIYTNIMAHRYRVEEFESGLS